MERTFPPAPLGVRVVAWIIDHALPVIAALIVALVFQRAEGGLSAASVVILAVCLILTVGWGVYLWWSGGERGATPGLRLMGLQVVSVHDGKPVGWGRYLARLASVTALAMTVLGWPLMLIWLTAHRQRRGWHDIAAGAIVTPRPRVRTEFESPRAPTGRQSVPLPAHLRAWAPTGPQNFESSAPEPIVQAAPPPTSMPAAEGGYRPAEPTGPAPAYHASQHTGPRPVGPQHTGPQQPGPQHAASQGFQPDLAPDGSWAPKTADPTTPPPPPEPVQPPTPQTPSRPSAGEPQFQVSAPHTAADDDPDRTSLRPSELLNGAEEDPDRTTLRTDVQPGQAQPPTPPQPPPPKWQLVLEDGRTIPLDRAVVLGRRPTQPPGRPVHLIAVEDTTRTLSKSHIRVDADDDSPFVTDLGSTNGSALITSTGQLELHPRQPRRIPAGQVVKFGEHRFTVERSTAR